MWAQHKTMTKGQVSAITADVLTFLRPVSTFIRPGTGAILPRQEWLGHPWPVLTWQAQQHCCCKKVWHRKMLHSASCLMPQKMLSLLLVTNRPTNCCMLNQ